MCISSIYWHIIVLTLHKIIIILSYSCMNWHFFLIIWSCAHESFLSFYAQVSLCTWYDIKALHFFHKAIESMANPIQKTCGFSMNLKPWYLDIILNSVLIWECQRISICLINDTAIDINLISVVKTSKKIWKKAKQKIQIIIISLT